MFAVPWHGSTTTDMQQTCLFMYRLFNSAAERVMCNLRHRLFSHLMNQEIGFYDRIRTGELMNRLSEVKLWQSAARPYAHVTCHSRHERLVSCHFVPFL